MIHTDGVRRRAAIWLLLLAGTTIINGGALCAADLESEAWIGTWRAAPQAFIPAALLTFRNQTVRLIAHSSIGGRSLRLHLSNAYGKKPLTLGPVRIAVRACGANIRADTQRIVRFQGMDVVTIAAGATLIGVHLILLQ